MAHRSIGQERFDLADRPQASSSLDALAQLIDWRSIAGLLEPLYPASKGEPAWPPLAMFKALLLSVWYDLSDVKLAEALDDRASFRRFCGFSRNEVTPERTASASEADDEGRWVKHKGRAAVHGFKAHVGADATTALVEQVAVTPANVNDGRAGPEALPDAPGEVFADSAYRGSHFGQAVRARGGTPRIVATGCGAGTRPRCRPAWRPGTSRSIASALASRRSSEPGSAPTACVGCDGAASLRPPSKSISPPSPTT